MENLFFTSKFVDGKRINRLFDNKSFKRIPPYLLGFMYRRRWKRHDFKNKIDIKLLKYYIKKKVDLWVWARIGDLKIYDFICFLMDFYGWRNRNNLNIKINFLFISFQNKKHTLYFIIIFQYFQVQQIKDIAPFSFCIVTSPAIKELPVSHLHKWQNFICWFKVV